MSNDLPDRGSRMLWAIDSLLRSGTCLVQEDKGAGFPTPSSQHANDTVNEASVAVEVRRGLPICHNIQPFC